MGPPSDRALGNPVHDVLNGLDRCLDRGGLGLLLAGLGLAVGWWVYVPLHELLHAAACVAAGGSISRLEIDPLYGGGLLAGIFPFVSSGSDYAGRLSGFSTARSDCTAICGNGIIAAGEQCDNGEAENTGGHNRCNADCTIGEYCGDGVVQAGSEECDDADPARPSGCAGCRVIVVK